MHLCSLLFDSQFQPYKIRWSQLLNDVGVKNKNKGSNINQCLIIQIASSEDDMPARNKLTQKGLLNFRTIKGFHPTLLAIITKQIYTFIHLWFYNNWYAYILLEYTYLTSTILITNLNVVFYKIFIDTLWISRKTSRVTKDTDLLYVFNFSLILFPNFSTVPTIITRCFILFTLLINSTN